MKIEVEFHIDKIDGRIEECKRLSCILSQTIERRFAPDQVVSNALENIKCEMTLLTLDVRKLRKELGGAATTDNTS